MMFIPGVTVPDPPCIEQTWDALYDATLKSIRNPIGMPTLTELAHKGSKVVFVIPDIVKGGNQPTSHRKVAIRACLDELYSVGVEKEGHFAAVFQWPASRATVPEMKTILGPELFNEFYPSGQITSHDSEDYDHLVDLGYTAQGDHVIMNKYVYDADVAILIGHTQAILMAGIRADTNTAPRESATGAVSRLITCPRSCIVRTLCRCLPTVKCGINLISRAC